MVKVLRTAKFGKDVEIGNAKLRASSVMLLGEFECEHTLRVNGKVTGTIKVVSEYVPTGFEGQAEPVRSGMLTVHLLEAQLCRDTEMVAKMDPFAELVYGRGTDYHQEKKSSVKDSAGKTPVWNEKFTFEVKNLADDFIIRLYDKDLIGNDAIGATGFKVSTLCRLGGFEDWFQLTFGK